jgi:hypothetical protein
MNYLAHARDCLDRPQLLAGTALPDWLRILGRRARVRPFSLPPPGANGSVRDEILRGVHAHFADDRWFHATAAFRETTGEIAARIRRAHPAGGIRASFYAHVLLEMLLDARLAAEDPARAAAFQAALDSLDVSAFAREAATFAPVSPEDLARLVERFRAARILDGYADDGTVAERLDLVGRRVRQPALPPGFAAIVADGRSLVAAAADDLLAAPRGEGSAPGLYSGRGS